MKCCSSSYSGAYVSMQRVIIVYWLLKRFAPFSYLNHLFILSLNVKVCIRFIVFLEISLCFFICQELCWMRGLSISFTSSCFLFPVRGRGRGRGGVVKSLRTGGLKNFRTGEVTDLWGLFLLGVGGGGVCTPIHARFCNILLMYESHLYIHQAF